MKSILFENQNRNTLFSYQVKKVKSFVCESVKQLHRLFGPRGKYQ